MKKFYKRPLQNDMHLMTIEFLSSIFVLYSIYICPIDNKLALVSRHYKAFVFDTHLMNWKYYACTKYVLDSNLTVFIQFALDDAICNIIQIISIFCI